MSSHRLLPPVSTAIDTVASSSSSSSFSEEKADGSGAGSNSIFFSWYFLVLEVLLFAGLCSFLRLWCERKSWRNNNRINSNSSASNSRRVPVATFYRTAEENLLRTPIEGTVVNIGGESSAVAGSHFPSEPAPLFNNNNDHDNNPQTGSRRHFLLYSAPSDNHQRESGALRREHQTLLVVSPRSGSSFQPASPYGSAGYV